MSEKYTADRENYTDSSDSTSSKKEQEHEAAKKATKTALKGVAEYYAPGVGGKVVDALAKTKAGQAVINQGSKQLEKMPGVAKAAKKLDDSGGIDMADKAISASGGGAPGVPSAGGTPSSTTGTASPESSTSIAGVPSLPQGGMSESSEKDNSSGSSNDKKDGKTEIDGEATIDTKKIIKIGLIGLVLTSPFVLILLIVLFTTLNIARYNDALGVMDASGGPTGDITYLENDGEAKEFYIRVNEVKLDYQKKGKTVDALKVVSVYYVLGTHDSSVTYKKMTKSRIEKIADAMFDENDVYSEEIFKKNLKEKIIPKYLDDKTDEELDVIVEEILDYIQDYYSFIGQDNYSTCSGSGSCDYSIKGFYIPGAGNVTKNINVSNLKVRLMQCSGRFGSGTWGSPLQEDLVDFEKYVLGVAYQEIGDGQPDEAVKAQMIASRSFALGRPTQMGNALGKKLEEENGQWILQLCSCVADQVYCDPDKGCSAMNDGEQYGTVRTGTSYSKLLKRPMAEDATMRKLAKEVEGQVIVNEQKNIIVAGYTNIEQNQFISLARQGYDYKQILLKVYNSTRNYGATDIQKMNCGTSNINCTEVTGEYAEWIQYEGPWKDVRIGGSSKTIGQIGCLATSISMLIAKSGVPTNVEGEFNPGSFVTAMNKNGGFAAGGNLLWGAVQNVAPSFKFVGKSYVSGYSREQKLSTLANLLNQGYYVVAEVKGNTGQHWVAINSISGDTINMMDPATKSTSMWERYPWYNTSTYAYFKVE